MTEVAYFAYAMFIVLIAPSLSQRYRETLALVWFVLAALVTAVCVARLVLASHA